MAFPVALTLAAETAAAEKSFAEELIEEINCQTVFTIPIFGGIPVKESVVVTWILMAAILLFCFLMTRGFKVTNIGKRQAFMEWAFKWIENLVRDFIGEEGVQYVPYLVTVLLYIGIANICGIFGFKPPTKDINVTAALALMSIVLVQAASIRHNRVGGWIKSFAKPTPIVTPINIMELAIRPLSLCMRLFGNVLGAFVIMKLIESLIPVGIPMVFSLYFDFFDGLLQAYVFVFLTSLFIKEGLE